MRRMAKTAASSIVPLVHVVGLLAVVRRRRTLADVLECLRLYGTRLPLGTRGAATTLAAASLVPAHMLVYMFTMGAFIPQTVASTGLGKSVLSFALFLLQQLQYSVALVLMLYPMVVVGSLSADLRRDCSRTAALRLRREGLEPHEGIIRVVLNALVIPALYLSHSLVMLNRSEMSATSLSMAIVGLYSFFNLTLLSSSCQWFFLECRAIQQVLHGFLVEAGSLNSQETGEVSMFIKQIERQQTFGIWGIFEIDTKFTATIILAATSHVAVLVQFQTTFF
ncbi:Gustatory and pheromone receptor 32a [Frankliniella fusca]|uniref:Gustatory and pheromone receptor 32a n=1 Tax=Frankliniella fusca TaxID=407009 RepID=A0AAE1HJX7_9NEOP|nr:Gustatory and pheromone receptor 32a [Frankliniella fusca]